MQPLWNGTGAAAGDISGHDLGAALGELLSSTSAERAIEAARPFRGE